MLKKNSQFFSLAKVSAQRKVSDSLYLKGEQHKITKISETYHILTYIYKK